MSWLSAVGTLTSLAKAVTGAKRSYRITDTFTDPTTDGEHTVTMAVETSFQGFHVAVAFDGQERYARHHSWRAIPFSETIRFNGKPYEFYVLGYEFGIRSMQPR